MQDVLFASKVLPSLVPDQVVQPGGEFVHGKSQQEDAEDVNGGGFACAVGAEEGKQTSSFHVKVDALDRLDLAIGLTKVADFDHVHGQPLSFPNVLAEKQDFFIQSVYFIWNITNCLDSAGGFQPFPGQNTMPQGGGMDAVLADFLRFVLRGGSIKNALNGNKRVGVLLSQLAGDHDLVTEVPIPPILGKGTMVKGEGLDEDDLGTGRFGLFQDLAVANGEVLVGHAAKVANPVAVPGVVDADENGDQIGIMRQGVFLPAIHQVGDPVAGNAPVVEGQVIVGIERLQGADAHAGVAVA